MRTARGTVRLSRLVAACFLWASSVALGFGARIASAQYPHVAVVHVDPAPYQPENFDARAAAAQQYFAAHGDEYDFLIAFPIFPVDRSAAITSAETEGRHFMVRNAVRGTGLPMGEVAVDFGSQSRLKGFIDEYALVPGDDQTFDVALEVIAHEVAHQWSGAARFLDRRTGQVSDALLGLDGGHWSYFLDSDASVLYGADWVAAGGGRYTASATLKRYSSLDLYLMGFLAPEELEPVTLLQPSAGVTTPAASLPPAVGAQIPATPSTVTAADLIAAMGPRLPDSSTAQASFRAAFVIVAPPGQDPTADQLDFVDSLRVEWANRFFYMTRGRGIMQTELLEAGRLSPSADPSVAAGLDYLLSHQQGDGSWADSPPTAVRETGAGVQALAIFGREARIAQALSAAQAWLQASAMPENDSMSRRARGLLALGLPVTDSAAPDPDGGFGLAPGYGSTVIDTVLVGLTSREAGTFAPDVTQFLLHCQNADGGWPYLVGGPSQIDATAWVLQYLAPQQSEWSVRFAGESGLTFLESCRGLGGGYSLDGPARASEAAEVLLAFDAWHRALVGFPDALLAMQAADGSWDDSAYETATALRALRFLSTANLMVSSDELFLSSATATEGELVTAHVVVHNVGREQANGIRVRAFDGLGRPYGPAGVISNILPGAGQRLDLVLDTAGHAGERQVFVVVDPDGAIDQTTREDDRAVAALAVTGRPQGAELFVVAGAVNLAPASLTLLPATVTATAAIGNLGLGGATGVEVTMAFDGRTVATAVIDLPAGARVPVLLSASIDQASAPVNVTLTVDPANQIPEQRKDDNVASAMLGLTKAWDIQVAGVAVTPNPVEQGRDLDIGYTLSNRGTAPTTASTQVTIADAAGKLVATLTPVSSAMAPGQQLTAHATWRAARAGTFTAQVVATASGDADPTNNQGSAAFTVTPATRPNLRVDGTIAVEPDPPLAEQPATLRFAVANDGGSAAGAFQVLVAGGKPGDPPAPIATLTVPGLASGASVALSTAWTPATADAQAIQVTADSAGEVDEFDETDNVAVRTLEPRPIADLVLTDGDIVPSVAAPRPGQVVPVTVSVYNAGGQAAGATTLELFVGDPALGRLVGQASIGPIAAGARSSASLRWDPQGMTGVVELVARVNAARTVEEQRYDNDLGRRTVSIQDGALVVSNPYFSPNGDGVMDTTDVTYRLADPVPAEVHILDAQGQTVRTLAAGAAGAGTVTWDGRDDAGVMVRDGDYQVQVMAATGAGFQERGRAAVVLDTNRLRMSDVTDPSMVRWVDLAKDFGGGISAYPLRIMPDERTVLYTGDTHDPKYDGWDIYPITWTGFFEGPVAGGRAPTPIPWTHDAVGTLGYDYANIRTDYFTNRQILDVSQDGVRVAYGSELQLPSPSGWVYGGAGLLLFDLTTGEVREAIPPELDSEAKPTAVSSAQFAPDGRVWGGEYSSRGSYSQRSWRVGRRIYSAGPTGNPRLEIEHETEDIVDFRLSPGGERAALLTYPTACQGCTGYEVHLVIADLATGAERDLATYDLPWNWTALPWFDLQWTADGRSLFVAPGGGSGAFYSGSLVDAETGTARLQPWPDGVAFNGIPRYFVSDQDDALVFSGYPLQDGPSVYVAAPIGSTPRPIYSGKSRVEVSDVSPAETAMLGRQYDGVSSYPSQGTLQNLLNLTALLKGAPVVGSPGIVFRGIATDAHFDSYEISARPVGSAQPFTVVRTGLTPVRDDVFGTWVPPAPGLYEAVLTVFDKAGNVEESKTTVGWAKGAALANLLVDPPLFSPNGDGRLDSATVSYSVIVPGQYEFQVIDAMGSIVRRIARIHAEPGRTSFVWDGRREDGTVASDGIYRIEAQGVSQLVEVDCTPPDVRLSLGGRYLFGRNWITDDSPPALGPCAGCRLVPSTVPALDPLGASVDYPVALALISWERRDTNLAGFEVQVASEGSDQFEPVFQESSLSSTPGSGTSLRAAEVRGGTFRAAAWDAAGNYAYAGPDAYPGELVFTGIGDAAAFDPANGLDTLDGQWVQRADLLAQIESYTSTGDRNDSVPTQVPESLPFEQKAYAFSFATTARAPIVSYAVGWPSPVDGTMVLDTADVQMLAENAILWDARALPKRPFTATFIATDADGGTYTTSLRFSVNPIIDACTQVLLPSELSGAGMHSRVSISMKVPFVNPEADALASGSKFTFTPRGSSTPELVVPVSGTPWLDGATSSWTYEVLVDRDALQACDYLVQLAGVTVGGATVTGSTATNVCGLVVLGPTVVSGGRGQVQLAETFPGAVDRVEVTVKDGLSEVAAFSVPSFDGLAPASFPWTGCPGPEIKVTPVLGDPATQTGRLDFKACPNPPPEQCATFELRVSRNHGTLPACSHASTTYSIDTTFASPDLELTSVEEHLVSESNSVVELDTSAIGTGHVVTHHRDLSVDALPEDVFQLQGTATVRRPAPAAPFTVSTVAFDKVIVDKTPPQMAIVTPAQDQRLCSITVNGQSVLPFDVQGADDFIAELNLVVTAESGGGSHLYPAGGVLDPVTHFPLCELSPRSYRPRVLVPASDLPPGTYLAHLESADCSVGSFCSASRRFLVEGPAGLRSASVAPAAFAPDGGGTSSTAEFVYDVTGTGKLVATLIDDPARPRLLFEVAAPSGAGSINWPGIAADGGRVEDGTHTVRLQLTDACQATDTKTLTVGIDSIAPVVRIDSPARGAQVGATVAVSGLVSDANLRSWTLELAPASSPEARHLLASGSASVNGLLGSFPTGVVAEPAQLLTLKADDGVGHHSEITVPIQLTPRRLLAGFSVAPGLVSPNGDGKLDTAQAAAQLLDPANVELVLLDPLGAQVATIQPSQSVEAGSHAYGLDAVLAGRTDGDFLVQITATSGDVTEVETAPLTVDDTPPSIQPTFPADGAFVPGHAVVTGSISDLHLAAWSVALRTGGAEQPLASGTAAVNGRIASLAGLSDGAHQLVFRATDAAGTPAERDVAFVSDATAPAVSIHLAASGSFVSGLLGPVPVIASAQDANLAQVHVTATGAAGTRDLWSSSASPGSLSWDVGGEGDGPRLLRIDALDRAGNAASATVAATVDNTPPDVTIDLADGAFLKDPVVTGSVTDANLDHYTVELATGPATTAYDWTVIATGQSEAQSGALVSLMTLPAEGVHSLRVRATDLAGNVREVVRTFQVDTTPPAPPSALVAALQGTNDVALTWTASPSTDVAGYRILRGRAGDALAPRPGALVHGTTTVDAGVPDGTWTYAVVAVDLAELESSRSNEAGVEIDTARPTATIASPAAGARVRGVVTVAGTATAREFHEYRLSVGVGASPASFTVVRTSPAPTTGVLGTVDATGFASGATITLRLEAEDTRGRIAEARASVVVDNAAPAAPVLVSVTPSGRNAWIAWRASSESDLAGYLLLRNGVPVNAVEGASIDDLSRFLLARTSTSYSDSNLGDGSYTYVLQAVDQAGNVSPPSNAITIRIELRTPAATIVDPPNRARLAGSRLLTAQVADQDLASVRFEARARSDAPFTALGPALTAYPWVARLDWSAFPDGVVEVRAVATDTSGHADPNPASSFYFRDTAPEAPQVSTLTDGHTVEVSWTDVNVPGALAGYEVTTSDVTASPPALSGLASASSSAAGKTADAAHDGDPATSWTAAGPGPQRWELDLPEPQVVRGVQVSSGSSSPAALVSLRCRGLWIPVGSQSWGTLAISPAFEADAVALEFNSATLTPSLSEVQVDAVPLVAGPPVVVERTWGTGTHGVAATTPFGLVATGTASSNVYQPYVNSSQAVVRSPSVVLWGGWVASGATAHLYAGGTEIASVPADAYGYFSVEARLTAGDNIFTVQGVDAAGNRSVVSDPRTVRYEPLPQVALGLVLVSQAGSEASFAVTADGDVAQMTGIQVLRADASTATPVPVQQLAPDQLTFEDHGLVNGTYLYTVQPQFGDLTGVASNAVVVTVAVTPPAPPHDLTVALAPTQDALDLSWAYDDDPPFGFEIQRAEDQGGWEALGWTDGIGSFWEDGQVEPGVLYRYRIVALDALGNASEPSNEASGALPSQRPGAPRLVAPTDPDHPITVQNTTVLVGGFADRPGRTVSIFQNGRPLGTVQAQEPSTSRVPIPLARWVQDPFDVGIQDGGYLAYLSWDDAAQRQVLAIEDTGGGAAWTLTAPGAELSGRPALSPDGKQALVGGFDAVDGSYHLYGGEVASGLLLPLASAPEPDDTVAWSPDSTAYAFARSGTDGRELVVVDIATGTPRAIWSDPSVDEHAVAWLGAGTIVAILEPTDPAQPRVLASFDALTGVRADLFTGSSLERALGASAGGGWLVFAGTELTTGATGIYAVDAGTRSPWLVTPDWSGVDELAPSPDGARVAVRFGAWLSVAELSGGTTEDWGWCGWSHLAWTTRLGLVATGDGGTVRLDRGPWFQLPDVTLDAGLNSFRAYDVDTTGQRSDASALILVKHPVDLPDLAVTAAVAPQNPMRGQPVQAAIQVRNVGAVDSAPADLVVQLAAAGVVRDVARQTVPALAAGTSTSLPLHLDLAGLDGTLLLTAMIDPEQAVEDGDRSNNSAYATITITDADHVTVQVDAQPAIVDAGGVITGTAIVRNPGPDAAFTVRMRLADAGGDAVVAPDTSVSLAMGATATVARDLPVASILAGTYSLVAEVFSGNARVASAAVPVTVRAERSVALSLEADRYQYQPGDDVVLSSTVTNLSRNAALTGAIHRITVLDAAGVTAWSATDAQLPTLWIGAATGVDAVIPRGTLPAGAYTAVASVELDGVALAQATTSFAVLARDVLVATLGVTGTGDPPAVPAGGAAAVTVTFRNAGTAESPATTGRVVLLARTGDILSTQDLTVPALVPAAGAVQAMAIPTAGLALGTYSLALVVDEAAGAETLATGQFRLADGAPPTLALMSPAQGVVVPGVVYPWIRAHDGDTGVALVRANVGSAVTLLTMTDGNRFDGTWTGPISLGPDGPYTLVFSAADGDGNDGLTSPIDTNPITLTVVSDRTPPVLLVEGVADGALVNTPVVLNVTATDLHLASVAADIDGLAYQPGTPYVVEGTHVFRAIAVDLAGNATGEVRVFDLDMTPPDVAIAGVTDGQYLDSPVTPVIVVTDQNSTTYDALLDGSAWSGGPIAAEGRHVLAVDARDLAGNNRHAEVGFWIDLTPPTLAITGVENGVCYARPVTPVVSATDANLGSVSATLDDQPFTSGTTVGQEGTHALVAVALDKAGHQASAQVSFSIDTTPPAISMPDVDGKFFAQSVTLAFSVTDATAMVVQSTLDGVPFTSGGIVSAEGRHVLAVSARDCAGNETSRTATFVVDRTAPALVLSGVQDGAIVAGPVAITAEATDANLASVSLELDGAPYVAGTPITAHGLHLVNGVATDAAGNTTRASLGFTIDNAPPRISVDGVADGDVLGRAVTPIVTVTDEDLAGFDVTVDGVPLPPGGAVSAEGVHNLVVRAHDLAGNEASLTLTFTIDLTPPAIDIGGVANGVCYAHDVTPTYSAQDANLVTVSGTLNGVAFASGSTVSAEADHTLVVTARDRADHTASRTTAFVVDKTAPSVTITGLDGKYFAAPVTPSYSVSDAHLTVTTVTLDGAPLAPGASVSAEGPHTLVVAGEDCAGNKTTQSATFTIDVTPPTLTLTGVADSAIVHGSVSVTATVTDRTPTTLTMTLDGAPYVSGTSIVAQGAHVVAAVATDSAGNVARASRTFTIDNAAPEIQITGVTDGELTNQIVTPVITVTDANLGTWTATVDGVDLLPNGSITSEGKHTLVVVAQDLAGNEARATRSFEIDKTPPILSASVVDGAEYPAPVVVTYSATDAHLDTVTATLDGLPFASGGTVDAAGSHALQVTAHDAAGNDATRTYGFTVTGQEPTYHVKKYLASDDVRVLARVACGKAGDTSAAFLTRALPQAHLKYVRNDVDLLVGLRSGLYDLVVVTDQIGTWSRGASAAPSGPAAPVASMSGPTANCVDRDPCPPTGPVPPLNSIDLTKRLQAELTEAVHRGIGLVVFRTLTPADPWLRDALGLQFLGHESSTTVNIAQTGVSSPLQLKVLEGVALKLDDAKSIGTFKRDGKVAAAIHGYGLGEVVVLGFDPATASGGAEALVSGAVTFAFAEPDPAAASVVAVRIEVQDDGAAATTRVREHLDPGLVVESIRNGGLLLPDGDIEWTLDQGAGELDSLEYLLRLPETAGTYQTTAEVARMVAGQAEVVGTYPLSITLQAGAPELQAQAEQLAAAIPDNRSNRCHRQAILSDLAMVRSNRGRTPQEREAAIGALLDAVDQVRALQGVDATPLRLAIDSILAVWEGRR